MGNTCQPPPRKSPEMSPREEAAAHGGKVGSDAINSGNVSVPSSGPVAGSVHSNASDQSGSSALTHSLHTMMTREQKGRDIYKYYDVIEVLGVGSMGSVSCVRKKKDKLGGSARKKPAPSGIHGHLFELGRKMNALELVRPSSSSSSKSKKRASRAASGSEHCENMYALKSIHLKRISDAKFIDELRNEVEILRNLDHPNIVRPIETFEYRKQLCIVMELCSGGDLYVRDPYSEADAQRIVRKLLSAVAYMHRCGITHRDIKYENILFENDTPNAEIKLVDFGLSKKYFADAPQMYDGVGTIYTMAPQVLQGMYTSQADLWSVGVIAFMLLSSQMPFFGRKRSHVFDKIMNGNYSFNSKRWDLISDAGKDVVIALLQVDADERPIAEVALKLPWFANDFFANRRNTEEVQLHAVQENLEKFSKYSKIKKLALMVIAHKSSTEDIGFLRDAFAKYDIEKNGTICFEEFQAALADFGYKQDELRTMFAGVDLDGSGYIHYTEFLAATMETRGVIVEERLAEAFDRLDSDDSGYISKQNLREFLVDGFLGQALSDELIEGIINEGDFYKDGMISYEEFLMLWDNKSRNEESKETATTTKQRLQKDRLRASSSVRVGRVAS